MKKFLFDNLNQNIKSYQFIITLKKDTVSAQWY